jgi:NADPH:quinone reductase-like Zn-dependent oxidoreductase
MYDHYGPPDVVEVREIERPVPTDDRVLVRVSAASVNRADLDTLTARWGFTRLFLGLLRPKNPRLGIDVAGVVEAVGPAATKFRVGDRVFADLYSYGSGAFAEYVCAREKAFARVPDELELDEAATLPHSAVLAVQGLRHRGRTIQAGERVLVSGASGNVGPFAVQIAKTMGAEVTGVCSPTKIDFVRSLGADHVIDYTQVDYSRTSERYEWILDVDGHHSILRARRALAPRGVYLSLGGPGRRMLEYLFVAPILNRFSGRHAGIMLAWSPFKTADVEYLLALIAAGKLRTTIDRRFPLDQVADALRWVDDGRATGKVIVQP